jgi:DNA recombination protein RmuC
VQGIAQTSDELRKETNRLAQAMSNPNVRGRYGELQLQRVAELSGMRAYCDFATQATQTTSDGKLLRPDMLVKLPNERVIAVDAKTNIGAYLEALKATSAELAEPHLQRFAQHVVEQVQALSKKGYWREVASPEFVVMFVPGDQFLDAVLARKPDLIDLAAQANVVIASPSTLIALLRAIHVGWREKRLSDSAQALFELGKELHSRIGVALGHADKLGRSLGTALNDYNQFVGSVETRVLPTMRKFEDAGVQVGEPVRELTPIERTPRALAAPELDGTAAPARDER